MGQIKRLIDNDAAPAQSLAGFIAESFETDSVLSTEEDYLFDASAFDLLKEKAWWSRFTSAVSSVTQTYFRGLRQDLFALFILALLGAVVIHVTAFSPPFLEEALERSDTLIVLGGLLAVAAIFGLVFRFSQMSRIYKREIRRRESKPRVTVVPFEVWLGQEKIKFFLHPEGLIAKRSNNGFVLFVNKKWISDVEDWIESSDRWTSKYDPVPGLVIDIKPARENWRNETRLYIPNHFFVDKTVFAQSSRQALRQAAELQAKFKKGLAPTMMIVKEAE